eukprot:261621-Rhodomonas_salina.2
MQRTCDSLEHVGPKHAPLSFLRIISPSLPSQSWLRSFHDDDDDDDDDDDVHDDNAGDGGDDELGIQVHDR